MLRRPQVGDVRVLGVWGSRARRAKRGESWKQGPNLQSHPESNPGPSTNYARSWPLAQLAKGIFEEKKGKFEQHGYFQLRIFTCSRGPGSGVSWEWGDGGPTLASGPHSPPRFYPYQDINSNVV